MEGQTRERSRHHKTRRPRRAKNGSHGSRANGSRVPGDRHNPTNNAKTLPPAPKDPNAMDVDRTRQQMPPIKCFKCNKLGHMARDCKGRLDVRAMTHDEMMDYFEEQLTARKDREELKKKQDFPPATQ